MPETDLIGRLNKRAENGRVFHTDRKLFAEAATALSENIETINGQAMDLATLRARLAASEAEREKAVELIDEGRGILVSLIDNVTRHGNYSPESTCTFIDQAGGSFRAARAAPVPPVVGEDAVERAVIAYNTTPPGALANKDQMRAALASSVAKPCGVKGLLKDVLAYLEGGYPNVTSGGQRNADLRSRILAALSLPATDTARPLNSGEVEDWRDDHPDVIAFDAAVAAGRARIAARKPLDDDSIMEIIKEVAPWKDEPKLNDLLTYEKSPPLFPQATYDVPSYRAVRFVRAVEARIATLSSAPSTPEGWREIQQHVQPRIADGFTAVKISRPGHWFVKGPGPAVAATTAPAGGSDE